MNRRRPTDDAERGAVAILVLWGMALIFALVAAAGFASRIEVRIARSAIAASRARYAAEAGTQLGLVRLLRRRAAGAAVLDGTPERWQDGTTAVAISIADEAGRIDINEAPLELLQGLFVAIGRPHAEALLLACNIVAHRGGSPAGCPQSDNPAATPGGGHRFVAPEELAALPGFDASLYDAIADCVTVATGAAAIDPRDASRTVLLALPGATPGLVDAYLADRAMWHDFAGSGTMPIPLPAAPFLTVSPEVDFMISAVAATAGGARFRADLEVRLTGRPDHPYQVVAWRTPPAGNGGRAAPRRRVP